MEFVTYVESQNAFLTYHDLYDRLQSTHNNKLMEKLEPYRTIQWPAVYSTQPDILSGEDILNSEELKAICLRDVNYFVSHLINYFELFKILDHTRQWANGKSPILVEDMKNIAGIMKKLFVRGKEVNDIIRCMLLTANFQDFLSLAQFLATRYNVALKKPKADSSWPIPKLLVWCRGKSIDGKVATVEIQFCSSEIHNYLHSSANHKVYEDLRESCSFQADRLNNSAYNSFIIRLNKMAHVRGQMMKAHEVTIGSFALKEASNSDTVKITGEVASLITCRGIGYQKKAANRSAATSYLVDGSLTIVEDQALWSVDRFNFSVGNRVEFLVSFSDRGAVFLGLGEQYSYHGNVNGFNLTVMIDPHRIWIRDKFYGRQLHFDNYNLGDQKQAKVVLQRSAPGRMKISFS